MSISIWYKRENSKPEKIDEANTINQALYLAGEYCIAFGVYRGQHRYGKDKVWAGRRIDEPKN